MPTTRPLAGRSILVLDDDPDVLELYATSLARFGAEVKRASRTDLAIELVHAWQPDVVLCDLHLPDLDGYAFAESVRTSAQLDDVQLIAISGSHPGVERERSRAAGFTQHLTKPVRLSEIVAAIEAALATAHA